MTQDQWIILAFKVAVVSGFASIAGWVVLYSFLAPWWESPIGRTLVAKSVLIALLFVPTGLSLFFHLNRLDSVVAGWVDAGLIGLVTPVMIWRSVVWLKLHRNRELNTSQSARPGRTP
jgi:hypothetical protein